MYDSHLTLTVTGHQPVEAVDWAVVTISVCSVLSMEEYGAAVMSCSVVHHEKSQFLTKCSPVTGKQVMEWVVLSCIVLILDNILPTPP